MPRQKNMSGIAAIEHSLRDVDSRSCKVRFIVDISDSINWAAVNAHSQLDVWMILQCFADLKRTAHRLFQIAKKKQGHPVSHRHSIEPAACFRRSKAFGASHDLI